VKRITDRTPIGFCIELLLGSKYDGACQETLSQEIFTRTLLDWNKRVLSGTIMSRSLALLLITVSVLSSLVIVNAVSVQSIPKPSVPEFTLKLVDYMVGGGIETQIRNQPIIPNGHDSAGIYFDTRFKWHESTNWYHPEPDPTKWKRQYISQIGTTGVTTLVGSSNSYYEILGNTTSHQLDVQYRAINGYLNESVPFAPPIGIDPNDTPVVVVNTSEWSETVTITLPDYKPETYTTTPSPTINPTPTPISTTPTPCNEPQLIEQTVLLGLAVTVAVLGAGLGLLLYLIKRK